MPLARRRPEARRGGNVTAASDREWVEAAVAEHQGGLLRFASTLVGAAAAFDVVQDSFLELCTADRSQVEGHLAAWLFTVCRNRAISVRRKTARLRPEEEAGVDVAAESEPGRSIERKDEARLVVAAMEGLTERDREVVALRFAADLSYKEIAEVTGLTVSHVGVILHQAIKSVRAEVARRTPGGRK
jgi:RNA polymerase sigma factor (sigma-70 family)